MPKFYSKKTLNHEQAVACAKQAIISMGFAFNETHTEAGIDAFVELADPQTGAAAACFLGVQVKTQELFSAETPDHFSYYLDGEDLAYWMSSEIPILLIVFRARTDEAYAVFVQKYFALPENRNKKTVIFQKRQHRFVGDLNWQRLLLDGSAPRRLGLAFPASPSPEELSSNLLEAVLPKTVWSGTTALEKRPEVIAALRKLNFWEGEIVVRGKRIWTVHSLYDSTWGSIVKQDSITCSPFSMVAFHEDPAHRDCARELLNLCLNGRLRREDIFWSKDEEMFIYKPRANPTRRIRKLVKGKSGERRIGLLHVTDRGGRAVRCRHLAMISKFIDIGSKYYLRVDPTWYFSRNGFKHPRSEDLIRNIRIMQKEREYHGTLRLWREVLTQSEDLVRPNYPHLSFTDYLRFEAPVSVPDELWRASSDDPSQIEVAQEVLDLEE